jgi:CelD/BcsL family acetyltransferase involved in cellulose biosynthesis
VNTGKDIVRRDLHVELIDSYESWSEIGSAWNRLLDEAWTGTFFQTYEWLSAWAECSLQGRDRLHILAFSEGEQLVGIAPLYVHGRRLGPFTLKELRFLGSPDSDYLCVFARRKRERDVADAFYDHLYTGVGNKNWDQLVLGDIRADDPFLLHLLNRVEVAGKHAELGLSAYCPFVKLPLSERGYLDSLSPGWRKKYKQDIRVLGREQGVHHRIAVGAEAAEWLPEFFDLYNKKSGRSAKTLSIILNKLSEKCANPALRLDMLSISGRDMAGLLHLLHKDVISMYLMVVDKEYNPKISLGNVLVGQTICDAIESGYAEYNFLRGDERYKLHWANSGQSMMYIKMWQRGAKSILSALCRLSLHAGKLILR